MDLIHAKASRFFIVHIWLGTTTGMLIADAIGIIVGIVLGKNIPERFVKWFAATIFIIFGMLGLYDALPRHILTFPILVPSAIVLLLLILLVIRLNKKRY